MSIELQYTIMIYIIVFLFGITVGSFLNVCIYRIPKHENIAVESSHCMNCGKRLRWFELIPLISYLFLRGKCSGCGSKISPQYPLIEALNGFLWILVVSCTGFSFNGLLLCLMTSALLALSVIDGRTMEIPFGFNIFLMVIGILFTIYDYENAAEHIIGFFAVSIFLSIIFIATKGAGIGGGDIKLMASCGLILGWKCIILAFLIGCIAGSLIHIVRMTLFKANRVLAMGSFLSLGILISSLWGDDLINMYLNFTGIN